MEEEEEEEELRIKRQFFFAAVVIFPSNLKIKRIKFQIKQISIIIRGRKEERGKNKLWLRREKKNEFFFQK